MSGGLWAGFRSLKSALCLQRPGLRLHHRLSDLTEAQQEARGQSPPGGAVFTLRP